MSDFLVLSCEHARNRVPARFARLFRGRGDLLASHRGHDPGALELARACARRLQAPLYFGAITRLLVELNRSANHPAQFAAAKSLTIAERDSLLRQHYFPYRSQVEAEVEKAIGRGLRVVHVSVHSFTPQLDGTKRRADVGLLYDPARPGETAFCAILKTALASRRQDLKVRKNYPYLGKSDGFTTALRKKWTAGDYLGIELEVNQRWPLGEMTAWRILKRDLAEALAESLAGSHAWHKSRGHSGPLGGHRP